MKLLDLFCGAGGAAVGYHRAGFDEIVGIDIDNQRHYPFEFHQRDVMTVLTAYLREFDMIHASPPCQAYSVTRHSHKKAHPDLLPFVREMLVASGVPYVIENVVGAPMPDAFTLCGSSFGLSAYDDKSEQTLWLKRHRLFEASFAVPAVDCQCRGKKIGGVYGGGPSNRNPSWKRGGYTPPLPVQKELMGIDWMPGKPLKQAIPPAYTEHIGKAFIASLKAIAS